MAGVRRWLFGGEGDDLLYGGLGTDVAVFSKSWKNMTFSEFRRIHPGQGPFDIKQ